VVAFSEVASANDYVEKEVQFNNGNKQIVILLSKTCDAIAYYTFQIWYGRGFSDEKCLGKKQILRNLTVNQWRSLKN
jgi:hypothetical protein